MEDESRIKDIIYKRKNGETLVNDPEAIASCKKEQSRDIIDNARLGSYDKYGNYVIIPDIKRELISMPKLVYNTKTTGGTITYELKSNIAIFGDVFFKLVISSSQATLFIAESVNREAGGYLEMYDEPIDSLSVGKDGLPKSIIFRNYHITEDFNDFGKQENFECENILTRKVYLNLLSKELKKVSNIDEKQAFDKMVNTLKNGGVYGKKVLNEFVGRLKDRPAVFEIAETNSYNKAVNEVLLSALDVATTQEDKQDVEKKQVYLNVLNARNENIERDIKLASNNVDEVYVKNVVKKATDNQSSSQVRENEEITEEFLSKLNGSKENARKRTLEKAVLKQGKETKEKEKEDGKPKTKEEKVKELLKKKEAEKKKTPAGKKLKASKSKAKGKDKAKKLKGKPKKKVAKKSAKKNIKKGKLKAKGKNKKKKFKKAKFPAKAKARGGTFKSKPEGAKKGKKKDQKKGNVTIKMALAARDLNHTAPAPSIETTSNFTSNLSTLRQQPNTPASQNDKDNNQSDNAQYGVKAYDQKSNKYVSSNKDDLTVSLDRLHKPGELSKGATTPVTTLNNNQVNSIEKTQKPEDIDKESIVSQIKHQAEIASVEIPDAISGSNIKNEQETTSAANLNSEVIKNASIDVASPTVHINPEPISSIEPQVIPTEQTNT